MNLQDSSPSAALRRLVSGYQITQAIHVADKLGIADLLAHGSRSSDDLAAATRSHPGALYRLLRALASIGIFREEGARRFALTDLGEGLCSDTPESIAAWAAFIGGPAMWQAWDALLYSVKTGENAFRHVHGTDIWTMRAQDPEDSEAFDRAMASLSRQVMASVMAAYNFGRFQTIVDVGGGTGAFLAAILARHLSSRGILFDQPHVVSAAGPHLDAAGVVERCKVTGGNFFEAVPTGGDAYILKAIIHDWENDDCVRILRSCRKAMKDGGALLVVEQELLPPNEGLDAKFTDLTMLVGPGGRERTTAEYRVLLETAGFRFVGATPSTSGTSVYKSMSA